MADGGVPHFAERLGALFARVPRPDSARPYSNADVASSITKQGVSVTGVYLSQLRSGQRDNPSARLVAALASFFGVPITYFFDEHEARSITQQLDALALVRDARLKGIMSRATHLSDGGMTHLAGLIDHIVALEKGVDPNALASNNPEKED